uniref:Uncharacterized protein n=1 Tax=Candidatus Kentrum eta TaxID=2126337 RepID=A0A450VR02_9GAMM|nr:MAG: hypothetical protein BECKH772B_GA0070898_107531 [Candidatus Kentron sp. H]VFK07643.1 MAG: hypothetical protein BECKH772A_GA0070896_107571 [Candidatus Kentron sp. H]VFK11149.1 MAG: hypothetical protein BECKH772C_GA0070978_107771 [Candidatus Kentron sp. H]
MISLIGLFGSGFSGLGQDERRLPQRNLNESRPVCNLLSNEDQPLPIDKDDRRSQDRENQSEIFSMA